MRIFYAGKWHDRDQKIEVRNPYDGTLVDTVPQATAADVEAAIAAAVEGAKVMRELPPPCSPGRRSWAGSSVRRRARFWPRACSKRRARQKRSSYRQKRRSASV